MKGAIGGAVNECGTPMTGLVAGPRGRVFPYGYGRGIDPTPVCGCGTQMLLAVVEDYWFCPQCRPDCRPNEPVSEAVLR